MRASIQFLCPGCEKETVLRLPMPPGARECTACKGEFPTYPSGGVGEGRSVSRCAICGGERFYVQRDFNQKIGCLLVAVGAALSPFTYGISLLACLLVDLAVFMFVGEATLCYRCSAIYRGVARDPRHGAFDLHVADLDREEMKYLKRESQA